MRTIDVFVRECSIAIVKARSKEDAMCRRGPHHIVAQEGNYQRRVIFSKDHNMNYIQIFVGSSKHFEDVYDECIGIAKDEYKV
ncbi:hypothetical protein V1477_016850 [Vespula maculifrons]|uniref:Uncharacterized protein n=1 Tax=Vespula maculifrons TaxID=7453 RepID=A0ABD2B4A8_VESMC